MVTYNNGDFTDGGVKRTCLLDEGAVTVSSAYGIGGGTAATYSFAAEIKKGTVVVVSTDTANTWDNTKGSLLVTQPATGNDLIFGIVISEPEFTKKPGTTGAADTVAKRLAGGFLRAATVWFPCVTAMTKVTLKCANAANVVPGTANLKMDVSEVLANGGITVNDAATGGSANVIPMHYQAQSSTAVVPIMVAFIGGSFVAVN
ncbi:MAG: hypothetical protein PHN69_08070 [Candidatus Pacebacteria bacterium]|nr:hypothetical protein [Candidatus Paceibacterota bacterium]